MAEATAVDHRIAVAHGLKIHVRERGAGAKAVVFLPGLARTVEDFDALGAYLAEAGDRRVIAISSRGRGLSDRDPDPSRYQVAQEIEDALVALDALGVPKAAFIGTSRGGFLTMAIAATAPERISAAVLNDVGPEIEVDGLIRIRKMLANPAVPVSIEQGARWIERANGPRFPALGPVHWTAWARRSWRGADGDLEPACDPALIETLKGLDLTKPLPAVWPLFDALRDKPLMVVRGELSDLFSETQLARMAERRPDASIYQVAGQGHAPLLDDRPAMEAIVEFLDKAGC